eukprot:Lankesteria_metandrocarpae@DN6199_c0_g1_i1.p1
MEEMKSRNSLMCSAGDCLDTADTMKFDAKFAENKLFWIKQHKHVGETAKAITKVVSTSNGGHLYACTHTSVTTRCEMHFQVFTPPVSQLGSVPQLYVLCNAEVASKDLADMFDQAASWGIAVIIVAPECADLLRSDSSSSSKDDSNIWYVDREPSSTLVTNSLEVALDSNTASTDASAGRDIGIDAKETSQRHLNFYSYVVDELRAVVTANFPVRHDCMSLMGYKSGGHGAFLISLRRPEEFRSVSAITPFCILPRKILDDLGDTAPRWDITQFINSKLCPSSEVLKFPLFADVLDAAPNNKALYEHRRSTECCHEMAKILSERGIEMQLSKHEVEEFPPHEVICSWFGAHLQYHAEYLCPAKYSERVSTGSASTGQHLCTT